MNNLNMRGRGGRLGTAMLRSTLIGAAAILALGGAVQADPFDSARSHLQARQNAEALAIVDSGQFDVNMQTSEGYTLLHYAAGAGNLDMVRALLERGADPNLKADIGYTPYQMAIGSMVQAEIRRAMTARTNDAAGPRAAATTGLQSGQSQAVRGASNGMCAMAREENNGRSPADKPFLKAKDAVWYNHPDELAGLIEDCVAVDQQDAYGWTLLHHAADRDRVALAQILLEHGARGNIRNSDGQTAAQLATSAEMRRLLGPAPANAAPPAASSRATECRQKYEADAALASDSTGRMSAMRRWQQCLETGRYW